VAAAAAAAVVVVVAAHWEDTASVLVQARATAICQFQPPATSDKEAARRALASRGPRRKEKVIRRREYHNDHRRHPHRPLINFNIIHDNITITVVTIGNNHHRDRRRPAARSAGHHTCCRHPRTYRRPSAKRPTTRFHPSTPLERHIDLFHRRSRPSASNIDSLAGMAR
jgi:hypothetical protein